jgi:hypothetical protein
MGTGSADARDSVTARRIGVAFAVSVLVHTLALWQWRPALERSASELADERNARGPLIVQLAPPPRPPRARPPRPSVQPRRPAPPQARPREIPAPRQPARPQPRPPVIALDKPAATAPPAVPPTPPAPPPATRAPTTTDLLAYVEQQRSARRDLAGRAPSPQAAPAASARPAEDENARANRIAAANLGLGNAPVMGGDRRRGGGIFELLRMSYDYAEFGFYGWNKEMRRNTAQVIEVRKGNNPDIRIAIVRRMIVIIREHEQGDFTWESHRLGRVVTLSARPRDTGGLEDFLMKEFFEEGRPPARR